MSHESPGSGPDHRDDLAEAASRGSVDHLDALGPSASVEVLPEATVDRRLARIEMAGEEVALGWAPKPHQPLAPEVRYLHISRTIHELITDRNRSVGIFLFVGSVLIGACSGLLNVPEAVSAFVPLRTIQLWCLPVTFAVLGVIGVFNSLILIRARVGLLYEVAKMNAILGLPAPRVNRVSPLSIFFLMHLLVVLLGGLSAGLGLALTLSREVLSLIQLDQLAALPSVAGLVLAALYVLAFQTIYTIMVRRASTKAAASAAPNEVELRGRPRPEPSASQRTDHQRPTDLSRNSPGRSESIPTSE